MRRVTQNSSDAALSSVQHTMSGHVGAVLGVRSLCSNEAEAPGFLTWSNTGTVTGWSVDGEVTFTVSIPLEQTDDMYDVLNELRTVANLSGARYVVSGDKYGVLRYVARHSAHRRLLTIT